MMVLPNGNCQTGTVVFIMPNTIVRRSFDKSHSYVFIHALTDGERKIKGDHKKETKMRPKLNLQESTTEHSLLPASHQRFGLGMLGIEAVYTCVNKQMS